MSIENRKFDLSHRILHWLIAFTVLFIMFTVFLRLTWLDKNNIAAILQDNLKLLNISLNQDDAILIAKKIRKPMWDWHIYAGYFLIVLYILRMMHLYFNGIIFPNTLKKDKILKQKVQVWAYLIFYFLMAISLISGFFIVKGPVKYKDFLETIHVQSLYYVILFVIVHMAGIIVTELSDGKGIVSKMINGK
jgi:cytochrome b561